jgi:hypothetical protein
VTSVLLSPNGSDYVTDNKATEDSRKAVAQFAPSDQQFYPANHSMTVMQTETSNQLCSLSGGNSTVLVVDSEVCLRGSAAMAALENTKTAPPASGLKSVSNVVHQR